MCCWLAMSASIAWGRADRLFNCKQTGPLACVGDPCIRHCSCSIAWQELNSISGDQSKQPRNAGTLVITPAVNTKSRHACLHDAGRHSPFCWPQQVLFGPVEPRQAVTDHTSCVAGSVGDKVGGWTRHHTVQLIPVWSNNGHATQHNVTDKSHCM